MKAAQKCGAYLLGSTALAALLTAAPAFAQDATWSGAEDQYYSTGGNWVGGMPAVGSGTATFGTSSQTTVILDGHLELGTLSIQDNQAYTFNKTGAGHVTLTGGMDIQSGSSATFNISGERLHFLEGSAQSATINILPGGMVEFQNSTEAGTATINNGGALNFWGSSSAGSATITTSTGGVVALNNQSTADSATLVFTSDGRLDISDRYFALAMVGSIASGSTTSEVTLGSNTLAVGSNNASTTFAGTISGSGSLMKTGTGTLTLTGHNTFSGDTIISGGVLSISSSDNLGDTSEIGFFGGTLSTTATFTSDRNIAVPSYGTFNTAADTTFTATGTVSGMGSLIKNGAGTLKLMGNADYSGATRIMEGTLTLGARGAGSASSSYFLNHGATLAFAGSTAFELGSLVDGPDGGGEVLLGDQTRLQVGFDNADTSFSGVISGPGELWKQGAGWLTLTGTGSAIGGNLQVSASSTGGLEIAGGTFEAGDAVQISGGNLVVSGGAKLSIPETSTIGFVLSGGTAQVRGGGSRITDGYGTLVVASGATAELTIADGGVFETLGNAEVWATSDSTAAVIVTGNGSQWQVQGQLSVGAAPVGPFETTGTATVADGGTLAATLIDVSAGAFLNIGAGGTAGRIETGTIQLEGDLVADFTDEMTLHSDIAGAGVLAKSGTGTLTLTGNSSGFLGQTTISGGALHVGNDAWLGGTVDVLTGARLSGTGTVGTTTNSSGATIAPGASIGTLTINGDYIGADGTLEIETELGSDSSLSDLLVITGDTSGATNVVVINLGGAGAQTVEGIKIVDVGGASNGTFSLVSDYTFEGEAAVVGGAYAYRLYQGSVSNPSDGDWYLRSALVPLEPDPDTPLYQAGVPVYEAYAGALLGFIEIGTLQQRVGNRQWSVIAQGADGISGESQSEKQLGMWAEVQGVGGKFEPATTTTGADYDLSGWKFKAGFDIPVADLGTSVLIGGVSVHYGTYSADVDSVFGNGSIDGSGVGVGGSLTWYDDTGFYVDGQAQVTWFDSDLDSSTAGLSLVNGNEGVGYALSLEAGKRIALAPGWSTTPQAQLIYSAVDFDDFTDAFGASVSLDRADRLVGRLGITVDREVEWQDSLGHIGRSHLYGIASLYYDFGQGSKVDVAGVAIESENEALWGGVGIGGTLNFKNDRYSIFGEALAKSSLENFGDSHTINGTIGFRVRW